MAKLGWSILKAILQTTKWILLNIGHVHNITQKILRQNEKLMIFQALSASDIKTILRWVDHVTFGKRPHGKIARFKDGSQPYASYDCMTADYPRYPDLVDVSNNRTFDSKYILDVRPYMNVTPYTVYPETPVPQVFNLFRSMGLRHLPVVDHFGQVQGIITRHNLTHEYLEEILNEQREMEDMNIFQRL